MLVVYLQCLLITVGWYCCLLHLVMFGLLLWLYVVFRVDVFGRLVVNSVALIILWFEFGFVALWFVIVVLVAGLWWFLSYAGWLVIVALLVVFVLCWWLFVFTLILGCLIGYCLCLVGLRVVCGVGCLLLRFVVCSCFRFGLDVHCRGGGVLGLL